MAVELKSGCNAGRQLRFNSHAVVSQRRHRTFKSREHDVLQRIFNAHVLGRQLQLQPLDEGNKIGARGALEGDNAAHDVADNSASTR